MFAKTLQMFMSSFTNTHEHTYVIFSAQFIMSINKNKLYTFLWFFSNINEFDKFDEIFTEIESNSSSNIAILCMIFGVNEVKEYRDDSLITNDGIIHIGNGSARYQDMTVKFEPGECSINDACVFTWTEIENDWYMDIHNMEHSHISTPNDWKTEPLSGYALMRYGTMEMNSKYLFINIDEDIPEFSLWMIDECAYAIVRKGYTQYYPCTMNLNLTDNIKIVPDEEDESLEQSPEIE